MSLETYLPVNIQPIKPQIRKQAHCRGSKLLPSRISAERSGKVARVSPSPDRQKDLEVAVLLLQQEELLDTSIDIVSDIVPRITGEVLLDIGPGIRQVHLARVGVDVGESIQHMGQGLSRKLLRKIVAAVDSLDPSSIVVRRGNDHLARHLPS